MYVRLCVKYRYSGQILMKREFFCTFSKNSQMSSCIKIRAVGADLFRADRQTDGQTDGRTDRRTHGRTEGRTDRRTSRS